VSTTGPWRPWRDAWTQALYGPGGFYTAAEPADHFRTSVHVSPLFALALAELARGAGVDTVVDLGSGGGELLRHLAILAPDLHLIGVDLRPRPATLPPTADWTDRLPAEVQGLLVANELLDNVACDVVARAADGRLRLVEVNTDTGAERLGDPAGPAVERWVDTWWPLTGEGQRAEVGLAREDLWDDACGRLTRGLCIAVDYGHRREDRPPGGSLVSYREGRQTQVRPDRRHDITAAVAMDALAARVGGTLTRQRDVLHGLGMAGSRPPLERATSDPAGYVRALAAATHAAELTEVGGLGSFWWLIGSVGDTARGAGSPGR
jgi:SAM-dependent MidA family methyltransferase